MTDDDFLLLIETFLDRHPLSPTTFGLWAMDDSRFVFDLRKGRTCYGKTMVRVRRFMDEYEKKQEARRLRNMGHQSTQNAESHEKPATAQQLLEGTGAGQ